MEHDELRKSTNYPWCTAVVEPRDDEDDVVLLQGGKGAGVCGGWGVTMHSLASLLTQ